MVANPAFEGPSPQAGMRAISVRAVEPEPGFGRPYGAGEFCCGLSQDFVLGYYRRSLREQVVSSWANVMLATVYAGIRGLPPWRQKKAAKMGQGRFVFLL